MKVTKMSAEEMIAARLEADMINKKINHGHEGKKGGMDKDAFLKLLITELRYQDPTRPMEDREFIAQMAQFSTLEQMTNMNKEVINLLKSSRSAEAFSLLGKHVDALNPETSRRVSGMVSSIQYDGDEHMLMVGDERVRNSDTHPVRNAETGAANAAAPQTITNTLSTSVINNAVPSTDNQTKSRDAIQTK